MTKKRIVFVNVDAGIPSQAVTQEVLKLLKEKYGGLYSEQNVMIAVQHTHSAPGGVSHYIVYNGERNLHGDQCSTFKYETRNY
jgi:neutral ceramidase